MSSLYFGGGTPSFTPDIVRDAILAFRPLLSERAKIAMEVCPSHATWDFLCDIAAFGVNRISLGIESPDAVLLKCLVRRYSRDAATCISAGADQISAYPLFTFNHTTAGHPQQAERFVRADDRLRLRMQSGISELTRLAGFGRTSVWNYT